MHTLTATTLSLAAMLCDAVIDGERASISRAAVLKCSVLCIEHH